MIGKQRQRISPAADIYASLSSEHSQTIVLCYLVEQETLGNAIQYHHFAKCHLISTSLRLLVHSTCHTLAIKGPALETCLVAARSVSIDHLLLRSQFRRRHLDHQQTLDHLGRVLLLAFFADPRRRHHLHLLSNASGGESL